VQDSTDGQELEPFAGNMIFKIIMAEANKALMVCMDLTHFLLPTLYKW
jgi:hypothetical protein